MRYYSTQRPLEPGTFPRQDVPESIVNFNGKVFCEEIGREARGYVAYREAITEKQTHEYELTPGGTAGFVLVGHRADDAGGLKALIRHYTKHSTDLENAEEDN